MKLINFECPACRAKLVLDSAFMGQAVTCPHCAAALTVPSLLETPLPGPPATTAAPVTLPPAAAIPARPLPSPAPAARPDATSDDDEEESSSDSSDPRRRRKRKRRRTEAALATPASSENGVSVRSVRRQTSQGEKIEFSLQDTPPNPAESRRKLVLAILAILALAAVLTYGLIRLINDARDPGPAGESPLAPAAAVPTATQNEADQAGALAIVKKYLESADWPSRVYYVRSPETVRRLMEEYFSTHPDGPIPYRSLKFNGERKILTTRLIEIIVTLEDESELPFNVEVADGKYLIDWQRLASYDPWANFKSRRPADPRPLRANLRPADPRNAGLDPATEPPGSRLVEIVSERGPEGLYARLLPGQPAHRDLLPLLSSAPDAPPLLGTYTFRYPQNPPTPTYVELDQVLRLDLPPAR